MKRRTFIAATLAALAAPTIAASDLAKVAPDYSVWNVETLTAAMEKMFACQIGPQAAVFSLIDGKVVAVPVQETSDPEKPNDRWLDYVAPTDGEKRFRYDTYACAIEGGNAIDAEARLAKHFYDQLFKLPVGMLVWRVKPEFASTESVVYGHTYCTAEAVDDGLVSFERLPSDTELDPVNNTYRKVVSKKPMHSLRMRVSFPEINPDSALALVKKEGEQITYMQEAAYG